jgi:hypothetical protein
VLVLRCSADGSIEIFLSPVLSDGHRVAEGLAHELCHAADSKACHHRGEFITVAKALGFQKPWTSTPATPALEAHLHAMADAVGPYPHATLDSEATEATGKEKPGGTRLLKAECAGCGYTVRVTKKWLTAKGAPICPCNMLPMVAEMPEEEEPGEDGLEEAA